MRLPDAKSGFNIGILISLTSGPILARLSYVHSNAVRHGLVRQPTQYAWCSAAWFESNAERSFYQTVLRFRSDRIQIMDDFTINPADVQ